MALRYPTKLLHRITDITPELLQEMKVRALLLDVDNTLSEPESQAPFPGTIEWAQAMQKAGIALVILSNNYRERVAPFAAQYELPFEPFAMKPLPIGYRKAMKHLGVQASECAAVGDQVYTDIIGANLCGMKSILLDPVVLEEQRSFRVRRKWEQKIRAKMKGRGQK